MAVYSPSSLGINAPAGGFQELGWYQGRQYVGGTLGEAGVIHPASPQAGAGQAVSEEVNRASAATQGVEYTQFQNYLQEQNKKSAGIAQATTSTPTPTPYSPGGQTTTAPGGGTLQGITPQSTLNLPQLYEDLYSSSGISDLEKEYSQKEKDYIEAKAKINDNPFLSEATRVGRIAKIETLFAERTANLKNDIATKKADIETKLNLQTKQFDINSQAATQALNQLNTLLSMGALDGASGDTIAQLTRSTGISSDMIYSAISANKKKNVETQMVTSTADDGTVTVSVLNTETGELVKQTNLGKIGNKQTGATATQQKELDAQQNQSSLVGDIQRGAILADLVNHYVISGSGLTIEDVYRLYNTYSPYGKAGETLEQVKEGKFKTNQ